MGFFSGAFLFLSALLEYERQSIKIISSALKGNSNFFLHVFALITDLLAGAVISFFREEEKDCNLEYI
jgi:hypothetical protein